MNTALYNVGQRQRKRHTDNTALKLWWELYYQSMLVQTQRGPLIYNYLEKLLCVMNQARQNCTRLFAVRIDLHFPADGFVGSTDSDNAYMSAFLNRLQWELDAAGLKYPHKLRFAWCREQVNSIHPHYHLLLLLNGDAYNSLSYMGKTHDGCYGYDNLFHRIVRGWACAINWPQEYMEGLVQLARKPVTNGSATWFFRSDDQTEFADVFGAASYLCKEYSKPIGQGVHCFNVSRT